MVSRAVFNNDRLIVFPNFVDFADKAVADLWSGLYELRSKGVVTQDLPQSRDIPIQISFLDKAICPNVLHQLFFADGASGVLDEEQQHIENFRRKSDAHPTLCQLAIADVDAKRVEFVEVP